jgi:TPR repeat protein
MYFATGHVFAANAIDMFNTRQYQLAAPELRKMAIGGDSTALFIACNILPRIEGYEAGAEFIENNCKHGSGADFVGLCTTYFIGNCGTYFIGSGLTKDKAIALSWFSDANQKQNPYAQYMLAATDVDFNEYFLINGVLTYLNENGFNIFGSENMEQLYSRQVQLLQLPVRFGFHDANNKLGLLYLWGKGAEQDIEKSKQYFKIAKNDEKIAEIEKMQRERLSPEEFSLIKSWRTTTLSDTNGLAGFYADAAPKIYLDHGIAALKNNDLPLALEDLEKSEKMFLELLSNLQIDSYGLHGRINFYLGKIFSTNIGKYKGQLDKAIQYYEASSGLGNRDAKYRLYQIFEKQNPSVALNFLAGAAELGEIEAQKNLALQAWKINDSKEAAKWFNRASRQGDGVSQIMLGIQYYNGLGVLQDFILAHMWFNLAGQNSRLEEKTESNLILRFDREFARISRDDLVLKMSTQQIERAQELAKDFKIVFE